MNFDPSSFLRLISDQLDVDAICVGLGRFCPELAANNGRVQLTSSPKFVLAGFGHEFADWVSNDYWMVSLLQVATTSGGTELTSLPKYHLVDLSTTICQIGSECQFLEAYH